MGNVKYFGSMEKEELEDHKKNVKSTSFKSGRDLKLYICNCSHHQHSKNSAGVFVHPYDWNRLVKNHPKSNKIDTKLDKDILIPSNFSASSSTSKSVNSYYDYNYDED